MTSGMTVCRDIRGALALPPGDHEVVVPDACVAKFKASLRKRPSMFEMDKTEPTGHALIVRFRRLSPTEATEKKIRELKKDVHALRVTDFHDLKTDVDNVLRTHLVALERMQKTVDKFERRVKMMETAIIKMPPSGSLVEALNNKMDDIIEGRRRNVMDDIIEGRPRKEMKRKPNNEDLLETKRVEIVESSDVEEEEEDYVPLPPPQQEENEEEE
jgi:hypothetical protein